LSNFDAEMPTQGSSTASGTPHEVDARREAHGVDAGRATAAELSRRPSAIELRGVVKRYGPITAVDGLDLDVPEGICLGLLGPNGAGKSTTMRLLTGQAIADAGELRVLGHELPGDSKEARAKMGVVPQLDNLDVDVSVQDNLAVFARLYRVDDVGAAVDRALALSRLEGRRRDAVDELSGGMRRRLLLARGLVHNPRLVLLDEPTVGLDPQIRTELWSLIDGLRTEGATILMSTHYIEEAERLADEVAVMAHGKVISRGRPSELIATHAGRETAEVYGPPARLAEARATAESHGLSVRPAGPAIAIVGAERAEDGAVPPEAVRRAASLEDVFVLLTGAEAE
jgi:lipooligosaccharide transport system ATP-binding protein